MEQMSSAGILRTCVVLAFFCNSISHDDYVLCDYVIMCLILIKLMLYSINTNVLLIKLMLYSININIVLIKLKLDVGSISVIDPFDLFLPRLATNAIH